MRSQVLHTVWCNTSGEAAGEIWNWSQMRDDYYQFSHFLPYTFLFKTLGECAFWTWEWKSVRFFLSMRLWTTSASSRRELTSRVVCEIWPIHGQYKRVTICTCSYQLGYSELPGTQPQTLVHFIHSYFDKEFEVTFNKKGFKRDPCMCIHKNVT